uniref:Si:ch211-160o17.6 n=1 Tax=Sinocyclocheilus rhinocerous TaxID=307959 RepID=A0A673KGH9_9TELE
IINEYNNDNTDIQATEGQDDLIRPKKLFNPVLESSSRRGLHRELLVSHRWGLLPEKKPELKRVLDQRRLEQHREREQASHPPSDLEQELHKRRQRLLNQSDVPCDNDVFMSYRVRSIGLRHLEFHARTLKFNQRHLALLSVNHDLRTTTTTMAQ